MASQKHHGVGTNRGLNASEDEGYPRGLHRYLSRQVRHREDAEDLAQEAYLRYLQSPSRHSVLRPDRYIYQIALNLITEWRHRGDRVRRVDVDVTGIGGIEGGTPEDDGIQSERLQKILDAIPANYRQVLWMNKVEEKSYTQIAEELGLKPNTVLVYLARAVAAARRVELNARE